MERIVKKCHEHGIICLVDLAHAAGAIPLELDKMGIDGAQWCNYKYLNSGPGCTGGIYVNERHKDVLPGIRGWHGNARKTQFKMNNTFDPEIDARKY
jgi:kynureninase